MKLSVVMPSYNEKETLKEIIKRVQAAEPQDKEIIVVDDYSTDGSREILKNLESDNVKVLYHDRNRGKGFALKTGFAEAKGDIIMVQDADLEYDPQEIAELIRPIEDGRADVSYGTRFTGSKPQRVHMFSHNIGNKVMTLITNVLYNSTLSDMTTCYKAFKKEVIKSIDIKSPTFAIEAELSAKVLKKRLRLFEVPISYYGRRYEEGKQIKFYHAVGILWALFKFRFID